MLQMAIDDGVALSMSVHLNYVGSVQRKVSRLRAALWHPHQKLWNWTLVGRLDRLPGGHIAVRLVKLVDSAILAGRAIARRRATLGLPRLIRRPHLPGRVMHLDAGLHREARQIRVMYEWFGQRTNLQVIGFEASAQFYAASSAALADIPNVEIRHEAVVGPDYREPTVKLYHAGGDGEADSLFPERGTSYEETRAVRLSDTLKEIVPEVAVLLRMNIEGAELFVVEDLVDAGLVHRVAGYYGMWDDLYKIDPERDRSFRQLLRRQQIHTFTFNDRDLDSGLRRWAIRYDIETMLGAFAARRNASN